MLLLWLGYRCFFEASRQSTIHHLTAIWLVVVYCRCLQTIQPTLVGEKSALVVTQVWWLIVATMPPSRKANVAFEIMYSHACGWQFPNLILCQLHWAKWIFDKLSSDLFSAYLWSVKSCSRECSFLLKLHLGFNKNPISTILGFFSLRWNVVDDDAGDDDDQNQNRFRPKSFLGGEAPMKASV